MDAKESLTLEDIQEMINQLRAANRNKELQNQVESLISELLDGILNLNCNGMKIDLFKKDPKLSAIYCQEGTALQSKEKLHSRLTHRDILCYFNKSVAYAPLDSEALALGLAARSKFLCHLKKYEYAAIDVDRALPLVRSAELKTQLLTRKIDCKMSIGAYEEGRDFVKETRSAMALVDNKETRDKLEDTLLTLLARHRRKKETQTSEVPKNASFNPKISKAQRSKELLNAKNCVELRYNESHGRHLAVNRDVSTGEILVVEEGYAMNPNVEQLYSACTFCLKLAWNGVPCDTCCWVIFCSQECKTKALQHTHDIECKIFPYIVTTKAFSYNSYSYLTFRAILRAIKETEAKDKLNYLLKETKAVENNPDKRTVGFTNGVFRSDKFRSVLATQSVDPITPADKCLSVLAILSLFTPNDLKAAVEFKKHIGTNLNPSHYPAIKTIFTSVINKLIASPYQAGAQILCSCPKERNHDIIKKCLRKLGFIISPMLTLLNHSCIPNVAWIFTERKAVIYALRPIKKDEELFISYKSNLSMPTEARRQALKEDYDFTCDCLACVQDWPTRGLPERREAQQAQNMMLVWMEHYPNLFKVSAFKRESRNRNKNQRELLSRTYWERKDIGQILDLLKAAIDGIYAENDLYTAETKYYYFPEIFQWAVSDYYNGDAVMPEDVLGRD